MTQTRQQWNTQVFAARLQLAAATHAAVQVPVQPVVDSLADIARLRVREAMLPLQSDLAAMDRKLKLLTGGR